MEKVNTVSIGGINFNITKSGYRILSAFDSFLFLNISTAEEKLQIERQLAEYLKINSEQAGVSVDRYLAYDAVEFTVEKEKLNYFPNAKPRGAQKLFRDTDSNIFGGVCAGLGNYFNIDAVIVRLLFVILTFFGPGIIVYIILWIVLKEQPALYSEFNYGNRRV
ncbi:MAG: PspC domain-containing protein [Bacteroidota bacterium]|nr:PspC domain-containing protein [Bacteroidota bacterium]